MMKTFSAAVAQRTQSLIMKTDDMHEQRLRPIPKRVHKILGVLCVSAAILFSVGRPQSASAARLDGIDLPEQYEGRYKKLIDDLRCLVCQNETLADSDAELAADLRREIREKMVKGQSDKEITEFLVARYGDFVLYNPPVKPTTLMLWYGPFGLLALGVLVAVITIRRRGRRAPETINDEQRRQVQDLLRRQDEEKGS